MRTRPSALISATVLLACGLTGCTGGPASQGPWAAEPIDLCAAAAPDGAASKAVSVEGALGSAPTVGFDAPLNVSTLERSLVLEGEGEPIDDRSLVRYAATLVDASTGETIRTEGYDGAPSAPIPATSIGQYLGCATVGSRVVVATPSVEEDPATIWVLDVLGAQLGRADGEPQPTVDGMPEVELEESGAPVIRIPGGEPPAETEVAVLKKGAGPEVTAGESVMLQYTGVRWSNGQIFDSSWTSGAPTVLSTGDVITGYRSALEGQTVGSQVLVVIPPNDAYGEGEINEIDLTGETLVFVVDLLEVVPAG